MAKFGDIINELSENNTDMRYTIKLPEARKYSVGVSASEDEDDCIPYSQIANKLEMSLNNHMNNENNDDNILNICHAIILSFQQLYMKFVDASNATFMINISSLNRRQLYQLYDVHYYRQYLKNNGSSSNNNNIENNNGNKANRQASNLKLFEKLGFNCALDLVCFEYLETVHSSEKNASDVKTHVMYAFVLKQRITSIDSSVQEIARLMNDSFSRYKRSPL